MLLFSEYFIYSMKENAIIWCWIPNTGKNLHLKTWKWINLATWYINRILRALHVSLFTVIGSSRLCRLSKKLTDKMQKDTLKCSVVYLSTRPHFQSCRKVKQNITTLKSEKDNNYGSLWYEDIIVDKNYGKIWISNLQHHNLPPAKYLILN